MTLVLDTNEYVGALKELVEEGKEASLIVWGTSMAPFLGHNRDRVFFSAPDRPLKRGDIVFYQRDSGQFIMHRICRVAQEGYYISGDNQCELEGPVRRDQIFARITRAVRKGKTITEGSFWWEFFAGPWIALRPLRPCILKIHSLLKK